MIATTHRQVARRPQWPARRAASFHYDRPAEVLALLQHARSIVETGWVQNRWTRTEPARQVARPRSSVAGQLSTDGTAAACVVAAVALAVRARDPRADLAVATGPAIAHLWDAVHGGPRALRAAGRAAPHDVRIARMRELARWNDEPGRTRADVVAALDRAAAGVVALAVEPAHA
jgi:hypothetical protein